SLPSTDGSSSSGQVLRDRWRRSANHSRSPIQTDASPHHHAVACRRGSPRYDRAVVERRHRAGDSLEDHCRACKLDRQHTVIAANAEGRPLRVACGYCGSEHNYRGGPRLADGRGSAPSTTPKTSLSSPRPARQIFPLVSDRERIAPVVTADQL